MWDSAKFLNANIPGVCACVSYSPHPVSHDNQVCPSKALRNVEIISTECGNLILLLQGKGPEKPLPPQDARVALDKPHPLSPQMFFDI